MTMRSASDSVPMAECPTFQEGASLRGVYASAKPSANLSQSQRSDHVQHQTRRMRQSVSKYPLSPRSNQPSKNELPNRRILQRQSPVSVLPTLVFSKTPQAGP